MDFSDLAAASSSHEPSADGTVADGTVAGPVFAGDDAAGARDAAPHARRCYNCQTELRGAFCHVCGQRDQDLDIRFSQLASEWFGGVAGFDARIWRTLRVLFLEPGQLTIDFFEGRRARYVAPLRLYLVASLVMLLGLAWTGHSFIQSASSNDGIVRVSTNDPEDASEEEAAAQDVVPEDPADEEAALEAGGSSPTGESWEAIGESLETLGKGDEKDRRAFNASFRQFLPHALFLLVPVFALQLWVLFRRRYRRYLFHLIFSLHSHAAVFFVILLAKLADLAFGTRGVIGDIAGLGFLVYLFMALRRVYGDSRLAVGFKLFVLLMVHGILLALALLAAVILTAWRLEGG